VSHKARQVLPESECELLRALTGPDLKARARDLVEAGWSLASIANAFDPPKQRSSVRAWVTSPQRTPHTQPLPPVPSPSSYSSSSAYSTIAAAEKSGSRATPHASTSPTSSPASAARQKTAVVVAPRRRVYNPEAPVLTPRTRDRIASLAPVARRYRARTNPDSPLARANAELTDTCVRMYSAGASVRELAAAAGVTYRAMARRLGR